MTARLREEALPVAFVELIAAFGIIGLCSTGKAAGIGWICDLGLRAVSIFHCIANHTLSKLITYPLCVQVKVFGNGNIKAVCFFNTVFHVKPCDKFIPFFCGVGRCSLNRVPVNYSVCSFNVTALVVSDCYSMGLGNPLGVKHNVLCRHCCGIPVDFCSIRADLRRIPTGKFISALLRTGGITRNKIFIG